MGEDLQEVVRSLRKEGRLFGSNKTLTQSHITEIKKKKKVERRSNMVKQINTQLLSPLSQSLSQSLTSATITVQANSDSDDLQSVTVMTFNQDTVECFVEGSS